MNQLSVGRIPGGAIVERAVPNAVTQAGGTCSWNCATSDFDTTQQIVAAVNNQFGMRHGARARRPHDPVARARRSVAAGRRSWRSLRTSTSRPSQAAAKVILNARTGSIVMNQMVTLQNCAVAHGNLSVVINTQTGGQPAGRVLERPDGRGEAVADPVEAGQRRAQDAARRAPISRTS